jgi:predicted phosphohydrolase
MYFHIISDIHLEFAPFTLKSHPNKYNTDEKEEINLILAGDIGYPEFKNYKEFITHTSKLYDNVFLICGNHEYYKQSMEKVPEVIKNLIKDLKNVHFLNNDIILHNNVYIIGTTLWSFIEDPTLSKYISDFKQIENFSVDKYNNLYQNNIEFLENSLNIVKNNNKKCIIITHHLPSFSMIHEKYKEYGNMNQLFASNCENILNNFNDSILFWACGHSHTYLRKNINGIDIICNPKGYPSEYSMYDKKLLIKV